MQYFEQLELNNDKEGQDIPDIYYAVYQNIIAISLFNHEAHLFSHNLDGVHNLDHLEQLINGKQQSKFRFEKI